MGLFIVFEAIFTYLRAYLILFITSRVDVRLSEYLFDNVLKLPIDYFERKQVGIIGRDMNEIWRVRTFLTGQLFGTMLDSLTLLVFLPVMFVFSPLLTIRRAGFLRADCRLAAAYAAALPQTLQRGHARRKASAGRLHCCRRFRACGRSSRWRSRIAAAAAIGTCTSRASRS